MAAKFNIGERIKGFGNNGLPVEGVVRASSCYSVGNYYDILTDAGELVKVDEKRAKTAAASVEG